MGDGAMINLNDRCPACHGRLDASSPHVLSGHDELLFRDESTGRWQHLLCRIEVDRGKSEETLLPLPGAELRVLRSLDGEPRAHNERSDDHGRDLR